MNWEDGRDQLVLGLAGPGTPFSGRWVTYEKAPQQYLPSPSHLAVAELLRVARDVCERNLRLRKALEEQTLVLTEMQYSLGSSMAETVAQQVRDAAATTEGVERAFVASDGRRFLLTGRTWTPELSHTAAALAVRLSREVGGGKTCIRGGYRDVAEPVVPDMECVFSRQCECGCVRPAYKPHGYSKPRLRLVRP